MGPLKPDLAELIVGFVLFAFVFLMFWKILLPRIARTIAERHNALEGGFDRAASAHADSEAVVAELRAEIAETRRQAALVRQEAAEEGARLMAEAREEGLRIRAELITTAHDQLNAEVTLASASLHAELGLIATELAGKVLGEPVGPLVAESDVVERFLAELEAADSGKG